MFQYWEKGLKNIKMTNSAAQQLENYYQMIIITNKKFNLTRITAKKEVYFKHFYDALLISNDVELTNEKIADVGSGVGIPGIILKIFFPHLSLTIIEANQKKCHFLQEVVKTLNLSNVTIINERAEIFGQKNREMFDIVVARAVGALNILSELCLPLVKVSGLFVAYKAINFDIELLRAKIAILELGASLQKVSLYHLPYNYGIRNLLYFVKDKVTKAKYPRDFHQIKNKPL